MKPETAIRAAALRLAADVLEMLDERESDLAEFLADERWQAGIVATTLPEIEDLPEGIDPADRAQREVIRQLMVQALH